MIYELINYLSNTPNPQHSVVYQSVNTPAMMTLLGIGTTTDVKNVAVYQNRVQNPVAPYVRLIATSETQAMTGLVGGGYINRPVMLVECVSINSDETGYLAQKRANAMRLAVESAIVRAKYNRPALRQNDLGGSGGFDQIDTWDIDPRRADPVVSGPGGQDTAKVWTATATSRVILTVTQARLGFH